MPSPRTDRTESVPWWRGVDPRGMARLAQRLNVRLVLALGAVALVGLAVSGIAISQILPGYFADQTQQQLETTLESTEVLLQQRLTSAAEVDERSVLDPGIRDLIVELVATDAAAFFGATVTIVDATNGVVAASEAPPNPRTLESQGLRRDDQVEPEGEVERFQLTEDLTTRYEIIISQPYTARQLTLERIREALLASGLLALIVSFFTGIVAARTVTRPVRRLGGVARRIAQGELDERVPQSGVLELDELGRQFNVMADRLAGTLRTLEGDRDRLREFVADVSHELRTPIAALRMYNELLREGGVDAATRVEFMQRSNEQIRRLEWLSTNLLDLSRIDAGIFPLDMRVGDLRDPVQAVVQALSEVAVKRGVALSSQAPAQPVELRFDRERIVQLLTNLVGNALKFTPTGGSVSVTLSDSTGGAEITVTDTGAGIPEEELPRVFERFYRGTNTGDARASGSGLGLAIVRSIVDMHAGEIDVASVVGEGTSFRIRLPRVAVVDVPPERRNVNETLLSDHQAHTATS